MNRINTYLLINGNRLKVTIKTNIFNNRPCVDAVLFPYNYWVHFCPKEGEDINQQIIKMFEDLIKVNKKNRKNNKHLKNNKDVNNKNFGQNIVIEETDGNFLLGFKQ